MTAASSSAKAGATRRSASSRSSTALSARQTPLHASSSSSRPGVATSTAAPPPSARSCGLIETPPCTAAMRGGTPLPPASACSARLIAMNVSAVCVASSRVGDSTSACTWLPRRRGALSASRCSSGRAKAAVLPDPVSASTQQSAPARIAGIACACTRVGAAQPCAAAARCIARLSPSAAKLVGSNSTSSISTSTASSTTSLSSSSRAAHITAPPPPRARPPPPPPPPPRSAARRGASAMKLHASTRPRLLALSRRSSSHRVARAARSSARSLGIDASLETSDVYHSDACGAAALCRMCVATKRRSPPAHHSSPCVPPKLRRAPPPALPRPRHLRVLAAAAASAEA